MEVAFIGHFSNGRREFRYVDAEPGHKLLPGDGNAIDDTYCKRIVDGRFPELIPDVATLPAAQQLAVTAELGIGSYVGVPIRLRDGSVYGTFCSFSSTADRSLNDRDVAMMRAFAEIAAEQLEVELQDTERRREITERVHAVIDGEAMSIVYQPIVDLAQNAVIGYEALSRFATLPVRPPNEWFADAAIVGLDAALEMRAIQRALQGIVRAPAEAYISVNASPLHIESGEFGRVLDTIPCERVVLEITEHAMISDYAAVLKACRLLRGRGIRLAIDDAGSGYASFRHILNLEPDFIKLDMSLTRNIDADSRRQALAAAFVAFAEKTGSQIVAEGVETIAEVETLRGLGVQKAQGYLLGRPGALPGAT
jgi:EAL domain-containing protein (putative c-di-GMP-specific phosphodiesterase class I)